MPNKLELKIKKLFKDYTYEIGEFWIILTKKISKTKNIIISINKIFGSIMYEEEEKTSHSIRYEPGVLSFNEIKNLSKVIKLIEKGIEVNNNEI